jgi:soluble lytic murein transglycosylase-like protein
MTRINQLIALATTIMMTTETHSSQRQALEPRCLAYTSAYWGVPGELLEAIHEVEAGWPGAVNRNRNGSYDMGPMQHNSRTAQDLARKYGVRMDDLLWNECVSVWVSGWELATSARRHGDWRLAIAAYNAGDGAVRRAVKQRGGIPDDISELDIPDHTKHEYVPRVMEAWGRRMARTKALPAK